MMLFCPALFMLSRYNHVFLIPDRNYLLKENQMLRIAADCMYALRLDTRTLCVHKLPVSHLALSRFLLILYGHVVNTTRAMSE